MQNPKKPIRRRCKCCGEFFEPKYRNQTWCCDDCRDQLMFEQLCRDRENAMKAIERKKRRDNQREERNRKRKENQLHPRSYWIHQAQTVFNAYIRERDAQLPCISCGTYYGDQCGWDAGHYRTVAAAGHLRFNEDNVHRQCKHCNQRLDGNIPAYRTALIRKIGLARVEALENNNEIHKWTIEECKEIAKVYQAKLDALRRKAA
ncbi:recombination protein NinG [Escherichia coli]|nr:recombination protein NinG [Escherichia coli]MDZ9739502.1 recombination protein NinG [Escherichia coli]MEA0398270.1 recombination protein NinG [Escherichia coli]MEA0529157.1 recombination protein NinG [Escherichia coli]